MKKIMPMLLLSVFTLFMSSCSKTEDKIVDRVEALDEILKDNMDEPAKGVDEMIDYLEDKGPETIKLAMELGIELANIDGDGDREERVKEIQEAMETPIKNLKGTMEKFMTKAMADKEAAAKFKEYGKRWESLGKAMPVSLLR